MANKYVAVTEVLTREVYIEPKSLPIEEFVKHLIFKPSKESSTQKPFLSFELSQETFDFINSVANISVPLFGEKEYKINDLSFKIYPKEDYEKMFGKLQN